MAYDRRVNSIHEQKNRTKIRSRSDILDRIVAPDFSISTGFAKLDRNVMGFRPGEFSVLAGAPHSGKTLCALNMIARNPEMRTVLVSADESAQKIWTALAAMHSKTPRSVLEQEVDLLRRFIGEAIDSFPSLQILDEPFGVGELGQLIDAYEDEYEHRPDLLVYDYLQVLPAAGGGDWNERANKMKKLASDTGVHIMALSQPKKEWYDSVPSMAGLSGGGDQQAINLLWCERREKMTKTYDEEDITWDDDECPAIHVSVIKAKNGKVRSPDEALMLGITPYGSMHEYPAALKRTRRYRDEFGFDEEPPEDFDYEDVE